MTDNPQAVDVEDLALGFARALGVAPSEEIRRYVTEGQGRIPPGACLLAWDANSVHSYVFDTTNATCIRGASYRLKEIDDELREGRGLGVGPEQILFSGGGSGMAVMSKSRAEASEAIIHRRFAEKSLVGTCTTAVIDLGEGEAGFRGRVDDVFRTLTRNRFLSSPDAEPDVPFFVDRCRVCGRRAAARRAPRSAAPEGRLECEPCYQRIQIGKTNRRFANEPSDFQDISDRPEGGFYAVVYADGNGVGQLLSTLASPWEYASVSRAIDQLLRTTVEAQARLYGLASVEEEENGGPRNRRRRAGRYQLPICGGDDLVAILPGAVAVPFARDLLQAIQKGVDESPVLKSAYPPLGASAGVAVSHVKFPVRHLLSEAEGLLKLAKQRVYKDRETVRSALDFAVITDGSPRAESVVPERFAEEPPAILRSGRPYSLGEFEIFSERFEGVREARPGLGKSQLYALLRHFESGPAQLRSQILYQIGRRQEWQELVKKLGKEGVLSDAGMCVETVVPKYGGHPVFDFADMLDLFDHWQDAAEEGEP